MSNYKIIRSKRKTMCIEITPNAELIVRVPISATDEQVQKFITTHSKWIEKNLFAAQQRCLLNPPPDKAELEALRCEAKSYIPARVQELSVLTGLSYNGVKITTAATRFGSCSPKNSLCFSCRLMRYEKSAIDYVIVHELCHTVHHNHQKQFWSLVESFIPDYKQQQMLLKK